MPARFRYAAPSVACATVLAATFAWGQPGRPSGMPRIEPPAWAVPGDEENAATAWEYKVITLLSLLSEPGTPVNLQQLLAKQELMPARIEAGINKLGAEGWELCSGAGANGGLLIFKRPGVRHGQDTIP